jgi:hypothetical protein
VAFILEVYLTDFDLEQRAHQRVIDFLSFHPDGPAIATAESQSGYQAVADEVPNTIAQQTAVDLVQFLRGHRGT